MITVNQLRFSYKKELEILTDLNINLPEGHIYGLLGKNGTGKSTLLKLISGMLFPQSGTITAWGVTPQDRQPTFLSQIYYLAEDPYIPPMSMDKYVKFNAPFYTDFDYALLEDLVAQLEVDTRQKFTNMSMGQAKKALIAFGVACNTKLLIMDEPTNGLDIPSKGVFRRIISSIAAEERYVIISTHQVRDLESLIDGFIILNDCQILMSAMSDEITQKLSFRAIEEGDTPIYEERTARGNWGVAENTTGEESRIDIELLFNAAVNHPQRFIELFKKR